jgi:hypothetical protein
VIPSAPDEPKLTDAPRAKPGEAVLVVDDEELVRDLVIEVLDGDDVLSLFAA